jgi:sigma-B regulation protein RsbU (phosphoserine phosphatase)
LVLCVSNEKLKHAYSVISKDLEAAAKIQKGLLPETATTISGFKFDWLFCPSSFVAGDIFNFFRLSEDYVGFYLLDVSGHGTPAAMLSVTLSRILSPTAQQNSPLKRFVPDPPHYEVAAPREVVADLNKRFQNENESFQYFTMIYGIAGTGMDRITITQAGHPSPIIIPSTGSGRLIGEGGFPVGMLPDLEYEDQEFDFSVGDRLFFYSDGITECTNENMEMFSEERLISFLEEARDIPMRELMERLEKTLYKWRGSNEFEDDVSILGIERV